MLDIIQRYAPIVDCIRKEKIKDKKIVEIGGSGEGIAYYLPSFEIIDCDIEFSKNILPNVKAIKIKKEKIPLPNNYADIVISVDVLEHIPRHKREKLISEIFRIARRKVILAVPIGKESLDAVKKLDVLMSKKYNKKKDRYIKEHLKYGHPEVKEIIKIIKNLPIESKIKIKNNASIKLWLAFQKLYLSLPKLYLLFRYRRFSYFLFNPLIKISNFGQTMRKIFFIDLIIKN